MVELADFDDQVLGILVGLLVRTELLDDLVALVGEVGGDVLVVELLVGEGLFLHLLGNGGGAFVHSTPL